MNIVYADEFVKQLRKLPKNIQLRAVKQEALFRENFFYPSLHTEKLILRSKELWSIRVDKKYRIILRFAGDDAELVYFLAIGEHDWIYKYTNRL
jgi:mRNA-degrading endonuclease RelE of RelBE toxin-antitoxin system